jgi:hypothetical protein
MANKIFDQLLKEEIDVFINSFSKVSKKLFSKDDERLIHPGEFGMYRESIARKFMRSFTPANLDIDQGFLINSNNEVSTQCDIVIFDSKYTPLLKNSELQRFFPVETVCAVGEVKSTLSFSDFKIALHKLAKTKKISENVKSPSIIFRHQSGDFSPKEYSNDLITTFLICQKLDFDIKRIVDVYDESFEVRHRHNMILSIEDGLILYEYSTKDKPGVLHLPTIDGKQQLDWALQSYSEGDIRHFKVFCNYMFDALSFRTILFTQISDYMIYP